MLKSINKMFEEFNKVNICYCHWKSNEHLIEALNGDTDLDVLFDYSERNRLEEVLVKCDLKRFRATPLMQYNAIEDFIGFDKDTAKIWHLHVHYKMTLGEKHLKGYTITPWDKIILEKRIRDKNNIYISSPEVEYTLLLCRLALKIRYRDYFRKISKDDMEEINWLLKRINNKELKKTSEEMTNTEISNIIIDKVNDGLIYHRQLIKLQKKLRKHFKIYTGYNRITSYLTRIKREIFWLIGGIKRRLRINNYVANRRISPAGGIVVAILGCDGAGKSTTIKYLTKEFNKKIDTVSIYLGSGDGSSSFLRKPMKLVAKKVAGKGLGHKIEKEYKNNKKISLKSRLYNCAKIIWAISLAQEKKSKFKKMVLARNNGLLVITDRYPQILECGYSDGPLLNKYINNKSIFGRIARWERKIYENFSVNYPDLCIKLLVPTNIAIKRKPEMTIKEIENKKRVIKNMNISLKNIEIDTSNCFDDTISEIMDEIWKIV